MSVDLGRVLRSCWGLTAVSVMLVAMLIGGMAKWNRREKAASHTETDGPSCDTDIRQAKVHLSRVASSSAVAPTIADTPTQWSPGVNDHKPLAPVPAGMVWVPGGNFWMGTDDAHMPETRPWHRVTVDGFWMDKTDVTNVQFAQFVRATNYVTIAERTPRAEDYPGVPPENLVAGSIVFTPPDHPVELKDNREWWAYVPGANWRHPEGPSSNLKGRENHPVVHIAYEDAVACCKWARKRLPTEAEFDFASRGGLDRKRYDWGDEFRPHGKFMANTFQGNFPNKNTAEDGYHATAPVGSFPSNGFGLFDMSGNVWQWTSDWYRPDYYATLTATGEIAVNPKGPSDSYDPSEPGVLKRVHRGGSYLCTDQYCSRYIAGARGKGAPDTGTNHLGFRCVQDVSH